MIYMLLTCERLETKNKDGLDVQFLLTTDSFNCMTALGINSGDILIWYFQDFSNHSLALQCQFCSGPRTKHWERFRTD